MSATQHSTYSPAGLLFGAAYYPEYHATPGARRDVARDLDLMVAASFNVIRVGESTWSTWEPRNGEFDLDWLAPTLDGAADRGIGVILGTPTYACPPWLQRAYPEIAAETATGRPAPWGGRQEIDITHPAFRFHAERVIRRVVDRFADHPAVIGYQVDNEPGALLPHNRGAFAAFVDDLRRTYGDVETLNREWGLVYWSHRLSDFAELWAPDGNLQPQYALAWRRFQARLVDEFIGWQAGIVREYARPEQFVTTCIAFDRPAMNEATVTGGLDVAAANAYFGAQDHLDLARELPAPDHWVRTGVHGLLELADRSWAAGPGRFLITETGAQAINLSWQNLPPYPGQLKQAALALVARGAAMVEYWHWHTLHYGTETYWGGVLPHSGQPDRVYAEIAEIGATLRALGNNLDGYEPDADVAVLWSTASKFAFESFPPFATPDGTPRPTAYAEIVRAFADGVLAAGGQVRYLHDEHLADHTAQALAAAYPVLVAAGFYTASDAQLLLFRDYAAAGGHLIVGVRTGYGDPEARARASVAPAFLAEPAGVWYEEFSNLVEPLRVSGPLVRSGEATSTEWVDGLIADGADVLAGYHHPRFSAFPAVTGRRHGEGFITYVGTVPNRALASDIVRHAAPVLIGDGWRRDPSVTVLSGRARARRVWFLHNWGPQQARAHAPHDVVDLVDGAPYPTGHTFTLQPWGCLVVADR